MISASNLQLRKKNMGEESEVLGKVRRRQRVRTGAVKEMEKESSVPLLAVLPSPLRRRGEGFGLTSPQ